MTDQKRQWRLRGEGTGTNNVTYDNQNYANTTTNPATNRRKNMQQHICEKN